MRLLTETPTHHPKNPVNSENSNHPTQGKGCNPDTPKFRGIIFAGWLPQWVWPTCKLCSIQKRGRIENHPLKTQIDL